MSVDCEAKLMYGWAVEEKDIPDIERHYNDGWDDMFDMSGDSYIVLDGKETKFWPDVVVVRESDYDALGQSYCYIGIPLSDGLDGREFAKQFNDLQAREVYRRVMGHEPDTSPSVLSFAHWW